jgi:hypothetical protein
MEDALHRADKILTQPDRLRHKGFQRIIKPFFAEGSPISIREFIVGALVPQSLVQNW